MGQMMPSPLGIRLDAHDSGHRDIGLPAFVALGLAIENPVADSVERRGEIVLLVWELVAQRALVVIPGVRLISKTAFTDAYPDDCDYRRSLAVNLARRERHLPPVWNRSEPVPRRKPASKLRAADVARLRQLC